MIPTKSALCNSIFSVYARKKSPDRYIYEYSSWGIISVIQFLFSVRFAGVVLHKDAAQRTDCAVHGDVQFLNRRLDHGLYLCRDLNSLCFKHLLFTEQEAGAALLLCTKLGALSKGRCVLTLLTIRIPNRLRHVPPTTAAQGTAQDCFHIPTGAVYPHQCPHIQTAKQKQNCSADSTNSSGFLSAY